MWLDLRTAATLAVTALLGASFAGEAAGQVDDAAEATAGCESTAAFTAPNTTGLAAEFVSAGAFTAQGSAAPGFGPDYSRLP
ncbi:MAG TPA: hypothetical protein VKQ06_08150, partial [Gammaproteobacteria bacterium]|nr:hypothetical protein [Gammaproteobacteria bacterium]